MNILKYFKKDFTAKKYCDLFYTFPDGTKIYKIKDSYIEKLPAKKLLSIQENTNYIVRLGVSKSILEVSQEKIERLSIECEIMTERKAKHTEILAKQKELTGYIKAQRLSIAEDSNTTSTILLSIFEMFFYFEDEPLFVNDEFWTEKKRDLLNKYPSLRGFFFKSLENYTTDLNITWKNVTSFAVAQTTIQEFIKQLKYTNTEDEKMD